MFRGPMPVPDGARVTLVLDKPQWFLGENILVHFCLENIGGKPFHFSYGGDYRGASRSLRFKVTATGPDGKPVADPNPSDFCMGGLGSEPELAPGHKFYFSLPLIRYCRLDQPGRYTLRVKHDLGWTETPARKTPVAEASLTLSMPTPAQARQVISDMDALPPTNGSLWGEKTDPYPDFSALRYPVYLPLLRERANSRGKPRAFETALEGIGSIPTPEATQALLFLMRDPDPKRRLQAAQTLAGRLPDPALHGKLGKRNPFEDQFAAPRLYLSRTSWRADFATPIRADARRLLLSGDTETIACGAFLLECVGTNEDLPPLMQALDRAIAKTQTTPPEPNQYPHPRGACLELERATRVRLEAGAGFPTFPASPAAQDLYLQALSVSPDARPADWQARCLTFLGSPVAYVRAQTLETLAERKPFPSSLTGPLRLRLPALLTDRDEDVRIPACWLAQTIKDPALRAPTLQALASARQFPLTDEATHAAIFQGARWEALKFWADKLDDGAQKQNALGFLILLLQWDHGSGSDSSFDAATGTALKAQWDEFLAAHRADIEAGKRYPRDAPEMQPLFPSKIFSFN